MKPTRRIDSAAIGDRQAEYRREEYRGALRALLMRPLLTADQAEFVAVRRHAEALRTWFARETGWVLAVERDVARLYKRPAECSDATRGFPEFDRRRYVLLCLAIAVLERAEPQITLRLLGERLLATAADPSFVERGFRFALDNVHERRELVAVCRWLLEWGVLARVAGDEGEYTDNPSAGDVLYDIHRRVLAGLLAAVRGPSTWPADAQPTSLEERLHALTGELQADGEEGRRTALRHLLARRLLDDPVVYFDDLDSETRAYFLNQRGLMAARLGEESGLAAEQRAEGTALIDESGQFTDVALPAEGTESHVTLLVAEFLAGRAAAGSVPVTDGEVATYLASLVDSAGRYWSKAAREPGGERELTRIALSRLEKLSLIRRESGVSHPLPALARVGLGEATLRMRSRPAQAQTDMFT